MKHPKKSFVSVVLAVAMVITCFLSFGGVNAAATTSIDYFTESVYYFYDCYPTVKESDLEMWFSPISLVLDGQNVTEDEFYGMIDDGYFATVEPGSLAIIDIKSFTPDQNWLITLFQNLRGRDCITVLATTYSETEIASSSLNNYLDLYFETSFEQLEQFVQISLDEAWPWDEYSGTCILIDENMVSLPNSHPTMHSLCASSPFLRILVLELARKVNVDNVPDLYENISVSTYNRIINVLCNDYNITFLVHKTNNSYRNLRTWGLVQPTTVTDLPGTRLCAFGFWELSSSFHNFLYTSQQILGYNNLPVYIYEIEPAGNVPSGLIINSDVDMAAYYGDIHEDIYGEVSDERERFIDALLEMMEEFI